MDNGFSHLRKSIEIDLWSNLIMLICKWFVMGLIGTINRNIMILNKITLILRLKFKLEIVSMMVKLNSLRPFSILSLYKSHKKPKVNS